MEWYSDGYLYARAPAEDDSKKDKEDSKGKSKESGSGSKSKSSSSASASSNGSSDNDQGSWISTHVELVVAACVAGLVLVILALVLTWWCLKRKNQKKQIDAEGNILSSDAGSDFESKGGLEGGGDGQSAFAPADTANYPHFGAAQPPALPANETPNFGDPNTAGYTQQQVTGSSHHLAPGAVGLQHPGQPEHAGHSGQLRTMSEQSEPAEYMDDDHYNDPHYPHDADEGYQSQPGQSSDSQLNRDWDQQQHQQGEYYPHHVKNSLSDPRDSYYYNDKPT